MPERDGDPFGDFFVSAEERDGISRVRDATRKSLPKRFYKAATVVQQDDAFAVHLDGRPIRTPRGNPVTLPTQRAAELVAAEWAAQGEFIDPSAMPATRLVNSALDGVAQSLTEVADDVVKYAGSDLVCYRAGDPPALVAAQSATWDPVIAFARDCLGAQMTLAEGVAFVTQPPAAIEAVRQAVGALMQAPDAALRLAALHTITTLTGSALIALRVALGDMTPEDAWAAAHVDEDEQMRVWGLDAEALRRRTHRFEDMQAACALLAALDS